MHKILLSFFLLVVFLFPQSELLAQTRPGAQPAAPGGGTPPGTGATRPGAQPATGAVPAGQGVTRPAQQDQPSTATTTDICKTDPSKCTSASGQMCYIAPGSVDDGKPIPLGFGPPKTGKTGIYTAIGCIPTEPKALVEGLLKYGTFAAGGIAFLIMLLAALQMITAEGNPEIIKASQEKFYSAIVGLLLIIFAVLLMQVIGVDILGLPGLEPFIFDYSKGSQ